MTSIHGLGSPTRSRACRIIPPSGSMNSCPGIGSGMAGKNRQRSTANHNRSRLVNDRLRGLHRMRTFRPMFVCSDEPRRASRHKRRRLSRPSTSLFGRVFQAVDARHKASHDESISSAAGIRSSRRVRLRHPACRELGALPLPVGERGIRTLDRPAAGDLSQWER